MENVCWKEFAGLFLVSVLLLKTCIHGQVVGVLLVYQGTRVSHRRPTGAFDSVRQKQKNGTSSVGSRYQSVYHVPNVFK